MLQEQLRPQWLRPAATAVDLLLHAHLQYHQHHRLHDPVLVRTLQLQLSLQPLLVPRHHLQHLSAAGPTAASACQQRRAPAHPPCR